MSTQSTAVKQIASEDFDAIKIPQTFTLFYIHGGNAHVKTKNFNFLGTREQAIARGRSHCETMNYRFIRVEPFFSDLSADERKALSS